MRPILYSTTSLIPLLFLIISRLIYARHSINLTRNPYDIFPLFHPFSIYPCLVRVSNYARRQTRRSVSLAGPRLIASPRAPPIKYSHYHRSADPRASRTIRERIGERASLPLRARHPLSDVPLSHRRPRPLGGSMTGDQPGARRDTPPSARRAAWMQGPRHFDGFSRRDLLRASHPPFRPPLSPSAPHQPFHPSAGHPLLLFLFSSFPCPLPPVLHARRCT